MTGIIKLKIGGQERTLRFNNFSAIELSKIIYNGEQPNFETEDLMNRIMKLNEKNHYLLIKTLIYAGIIGNDYVVGFTESATPENVGEWISELSSEEIYSVWITFWQSMGVDLPSLKELEKDSVAEKKSTWYEICQEIFGEVGILPKNFYEMTFAETILTLRGHHTGQARDWEKYRLVAYQVYTSIPKKSPNKSIQDYFPLPTDQSGKKLNPEMVKARRQAFLDKMAKN